MNNKKDEIANAAVEIIEILKYAPLEVKLRIPFEYRKFLNDAAKTSIHKWKYDISKKLKEQNMSEMTKEILCTMYKKILKS